MQPQKLDSRLEDWLSSLETDVFGGDPAEEQKIRGIPGIIGQSEASNKHKTSNQHRDWKYMRNKPVKEDCLPMKDSLLKLMKK